uniref:Laminin G domain-containing protein n=1 Tax=Ciona intestinalis TaxID=7719 RepID=H2XW74_CIOIN
MWLPTFYVVLLFNIFKTVLCQFTVANGIYSFGYFNGTSKAKLSNVLDVLRPQTGFSFRTCMDHGTLFYQRNIIGDSITLKLDNGDVIFSLQSVVDNINTSVSYEGNFNNNEWIHVMFQHNSTTDQGSNLYLSIGNHTNLLYNSITDPTIFNMEFSESSVTFIGGNEDPNENFNGCLSSGPYFNFQAYNGTNVQWNNCPLLNTNICGPRCNDSVCNNGSCIATNTEISC